MFVRWDGSGRSADGWHLHHLIPQPPNPPFPPPPKKKQSTCDLIVACNSTGFDLPKRLLGYKFHDGIIGVAGLISALSAVYKTYPTNPPPASRALPLLAPGKKTA